MAVPSVLERLHRWQLAVGVPGHQSVGHCGGGGGQTVVHMMGCVIVAPAHHRSYAQGDRLFGLPGERPSDGHQVAVAHAKDFSLHDRAVAVIGPGRPGVCREASALFVPFRVNGVEVEIGRKRIGPAFDVDPFFKVIYEDKSLTRWVARRQQQRMVAACVCTCDRAGCNPAKSVGLKPLKAERAFEVLAAFFINLHSYSCGGADWVVLHCARPTRGYLRSNPPTVAASRRRVSPIGRALREQEHRPICAALLPRLLNQFRDQSRPACLMTRADAGAVVSMEVFVEENRIWPEGIFLKLGGASEDGASPGVVAEKDAGQSP